MIRLAGILIVLVLACLVTAGYPVFAQGPPEQEDGSVSSSGKKDSSVSRFLLDAISERGGSGGTQQGAVTRDSGTRTRSDSGGGRADSGVSGSGGTDESEELLSGVTKDDFETSQTVDTLVRFDESGNVGVYIHLDSTDEESLQQVRSVVERVEIEGPEYGLVQAWVEPDSLGDLAGLEAVERITPPDYGRTEKGSTTTEGDAVHRANLARAFSGLSGEGVKVGVISDGVDAWTSARSRGDLPSRLEINPNQDSEGHEGTALLEIIHDLAPDADLAFSGSESSLGMAHAILWLANEAFEGEGADVIVDDLHYYYQPYFEDGIVAQAAADAVAGGTVYVAAGGNTGSRHYEGDFVDSGDGFHAFDGSSDITMRLRSPGSAFVVLQWSDQFGASANDYDLYLCPAGLTPTTFNLFNGICDASTDTQDGNDDPIEVASLFGADEVDVFIKKDSGNNRRLEMVFYGSAAREYGVSEGSVVHQDAVPGVLTVGAVNEADPGNDDIESFSSQGPSRIYFPSFETRSKPDVVASDGVSVTGSGGFPSHFFGTSAAAPHGAGIAALLIEAQRLADPTMTKKEVADAVVQKIKDTAVDLGPSGHDNKTGYGRADVLAAVVSLDQLSGTTFTVNSTGDGADSSSSDDMCDDGNGNCTLRAAIQEANRNDGSIIVFDISGGGARTIQPASALPTITRTVFIDGFSQSGASASNYRIELDGTNAGTNTNGLTISGTEAWVRGLSINEFGGNGIVLQGSGGKQVIDQNRIGTNDSGTGDSGNGKSGVLVSGSDRVILRDNLISGNDGHGVELSGGADYARIDNNIIGANASGTSDLGNTGSGIHISNGDEAIIGKNVIVGNDSHGVSLTGSSTEENLVAENYIGVNGSGTSIANSGSGVHIGRGSDDNIVEHNTIAHNTADGVTVVSSSATGNTVWENSMDSNGGLGIDLNDDGVTANDANDRDSGPNNLQNYAVLTSAGLSSDAGSIGFNLYVTQGNRYTADFYASDSCDGSGNGEGKEWLGFARVVPTTFGDRHFVVNTSRGTLNQYDYPSGTYITATVTLNGSTSEFSPCVRRIALPRFTLSDEVIEVAEDGTTNTTYTVRLATQPSHEATVDLTIEGSDAVTVSPTPLTFTTSNWDNTQTVTVTAVSDDDPEDEFTVIQHKMTIDSKQYVSEWLPVTVVDYDVPDVALVLGGTNRLTGFVSMDEGQSATYPVVLTAEPDDDVTVSIYSSSSSALRVSTSSLTFTKDNYDTAQNVTITARSDSDAEDELVNVYHEVLVGGSYYEVARVRAIITDPIFPRLTLSEDTLSVNEGETNTYTIVPATEPSRSFTLTLESNDTESVTVLPPTMTFNVGTNANWETEQTVTVTGVQDDDEFDDVALIRHLSTYSGIEYRLGSGVEVTVADGNRAPFFEEGVKITRSVPENSPQGTNVGEPVAATDLNSDTLTYTIEDQVGGPYEVDNTGQITVGTGAGLDYESRTAQEVQLTVEDPDGLSDTIEVQIEITDVNEPPVITGNQELEWQENRTGNLSRFRATDPERDTFEWSVIGTDFTFFSIDSGGYLKFNEPPDFEAEADANSDNVYEPTVVAMDTAGQFGTLNIKVTVTNANEPPTVTGEDDITIDENTDTFSRTYFASDPEGVASTFTWSLSGTDSGDFNIDTSTGELTFRNTPDFESPADSGRNNEYMIAVRATDDGGLRGSLDVTITVIDVNEAPTITGGETVSFPENSTRSVASYRATDPEQGTITWSDSGTDDDDFEITSDSSGRGVLTFVNVPDFENPADLNGDNDYLVTIEAYDGRNTATLDVIVTVTNSSGPEEPTITTTSRPVLTYQENGTGAVYTYRATDPQGRAVEWSLEGEDANDLSITRDGGVLAFTNPPDFEIPTDSNQDNVYEITVVVTDDQGLTDSFDVTIIVTNHHESLEPAITTGPSRGLTHHQLNYQENRTSTVYTYSARNYGSGSLSWSVSGTDAGDLTIATDTSGRGVLTFGSTPDFESPDDLDNDNYYEFTVLVANAGGYIDRLDVVVTVTDVNEGPEVIGGGDSFNVRENQDWSGASFTASDPEGGPITRWNLGGRDGSDFNISENGLMTFRSAPDYERPADSDRNNIYEVEVRPYDGRYYGSHNVTLTVGDVNEITGPATLDRSENFEGVLAIYRATGQGDLTVSPAWRLTGTDRGDFTINEGGDLTFRSNPDYERPADSNRDNKYMFTVQASDDRYYGTLDVTVTVTPVNEPPTITTTSRTSFTQQENRTTRLYTWRATDPEGGSTITWSLSGADSRFFTIDEQLGEFSFATTSPPDFEARSDSNNDNVYDVTIQVSDDSSPPNMETLDVTVTVTDVNEGPEITIGGTRFTVQENQDLTGADFTAEDPEQGTVTRWNLGGRDGGDFTISETGLLTFRSIPDYERPVDSDRNNIYEVEIRPYDGRYYGSHYVTVTVTPINEAPEITTTSGSATGLRQPENRTTRLYTYRATDPENRAIRWSVTGTHARFFTINDRGELFFSETSPPDYENRQGTSSDGNEYQVTVQASDGTHPDTLTVTVTVTDVNEGPKVTSGGNSFTVPENQAWSGASFIATDPEGDAITRWNLGGRDGSDFNITENGDMTFRNIPDHERPADSDRNNIYEVEVRPYDGRYYGSHAVTVTVTPENEAPTITTTSTSATILRQAENRTSRLYTYRATDPENRAIRWSVGGTDGRFFTIDERGQLSFKEENPPNFEIPSDAGRDNVYQVTVQASDGTHSDALTVTVTVTDVNEGPEISWSGNLLGNPPVSVPENQAQNTVLARYSATDPEGLVSPITRWSTSGRDGGDFVISEQGDLRFRNSPDFERPADSDRGNVYEVTIRASDGRYTGTLEETQIVTVTPINEPPTITTTSTSATSLRHPENRTSRLYTYRAADPERADVKWSVGGIHARFFSINERGELFFSKTNPPDYENPLGSGTDGQEYQVTVQASDDSIPANTASLPVTVTVTDVNEGPEITRTGTPPGIVPENQAQETVLARYNATDPEDTTATITRWSTSGRDGGDFVINEHGELRFRNSPDFERPADADRDNVYEVTIRASDGRYTGTLEETQVITVTNVNEPPVITTKSRTEFTQRENTASVLYTYRATDPDLNDVIRWSVEDADGDDFAIFGGVLTFRLLPDFEEPADANRDNLYEITVVAADLQGARDTVDATVTITEVNEGPKVSGTTSFTLAEGQDLIGVSFIANDQEGDAVTRWSLSGSDGGDFTISETGVMTFRNLPDYDSPADSNRDNEYLVSVRAYDSGNRYGSLDLTVTVTDVNEEAPVVTGRTSLSFRENTTTETRLYTYRATDSDRNTSFTWSVEGDDGGAFAIDEGVLTFRSPPDYEQPADRDTDNTYEITVVASDGSNRGELPVTVTVTEVNEGPELSGTATYSIPETQDNLVNATFTAVDPESDDVTRWSLTGTDSGDFTITDTSEQTGRNTAALTFRNPPDVDRPADSNRDNEYLVTIRAYDNRGAYGSYDVTVTVTGANEPPVITGSNERTFRENGTGTIYTYRATDPERDEFSWIQPAGDDGHLFDISDRGALTFKEPPDFDSPRNLDRDNEYEVTVRAEDSNSSIGTFEVTVTVTDINEGPTVTGTPAFTIDENKELRENQGSFSTTYSATDPEGEPITRWSLSGSDGGDFSIDESGVLTFRNTPDYDRPADSNRDNEYLVTVRAYDGRSYGTLDVTVTVTNENEHAPVIRSGSRTSFTYLEGSTSALYTYSATDQDKDDVITWAAGGTDGNLFEFDDRNRLVFREPPDYENPGDSGSDNRYELTVVATDSGNRSDTLTDVTVTVTALDEGPEPTGTTVYTVAEGQSLTNATFTAKDPDPGEGDDAVTGWRLAGTDAGDFNIGPTGTYYAQLTFRNTPDYDRPADSNRDNEYLVTIRAYNGSAYGSLDVIVTVTDQNEAEPEVTGSDTLSFRENTTTETRLYTYRATDMDRDTTIAWSLEGDDAGDFAINEGVLTFSSLPNYEQPADSDSDNVYEITVVASDGDNRDTLDVTITVTDVNEGPEVTGQAARTVSENFDQVVATYTATDPEGSDVTRWTLGGSDSGDFTITDTSQEGGPYTAELAFRNPPDFDRPADSDRNNEYLVTVRPYDGRNYGNFEVTVTVTSDNEPPVITGDDTRDFRENGTGIIYTYRATDPEGDDFTWSVGGQDGGYFDITDGGLTFKAPPNFESPPRPDDNDYQVTVQASDDRGSTGTFDVTVTVTDLNEGPEIAETSSNTAITVQENHDQVLATYNATDPEDPTADITRWSVTGRDGGDFTINEDGELTFRNPPDDERRADSNRDNVYEVTVRASDGRYYGSLDVVVTVEAVNEAPEFRSNSADTFTYQENGTSDLYTYRATDPEGTDVTWHLSGTDSGAFTISEDGVLAFNDPPDYEAPSDDGDDNVYQVTVIARDEQGRDRNLEVTVTVTNVTD